MAKKLFPGYAYPIINEDGTISIGPSNKLLAESSKGVAGGVALLDEGGKVPAEQLPVGQGGLTIGEVKADTDIADALTKKHANSLDHSNYLDHSNSFDHANTNDPTEAQKAALAGTSGTPGESNRFITNADPRNSDARTPTSHGHGPSEITGTAIIANDARLSDARTPISHSHAPGEVTGTAVVTADSRLSDARVPTSHDNTKHSIAYEAANANIQTHVISAHAPSDAQKNSDITKAEIEAKLIGELTSHTHPGGGGGLSHPQVMARAFMGF